MSIKNIYRYWALLLVIVGTATFTSGCATLSSSLTQDSDVKIKITKPSNSVYVSTAGIYEKNDKSVIQGTVRNSQGQGRIRGHADIVVLDPEGNIISQKVSLPRPRGSHSNVRSLRFYAFLDEVPPPGSVVLISAHKGSHF